MTKCVLFDLDETLFDRTLTLERFLTTQFVRFGNSLGQTTESEWVAKFVEMDARGQTSKRQLYPKILQQFEGDTSIVGQLITHFVEKSTRDAKAMPGMNELIDKLAGDEIPIGIITNGETELQLRTIEALGLNHHTNMILISQSVGIKKPDRRVFEMAADAMGLALSDCLFIGDNPRADVLGAHQAGMNVLWFNRERVAWPEHLPDMPGHEIHDLLQVLDHLD